LSAYENYSKKKIYFDGSMIIKKPFKTLKMGKMIISLTLLLIYI